MTRLARVLAAALCCAIGAAVPVRPPTGPPPPYPGLPPGSLPVLPLPPPVPHFDGLNRLWEIDNFLTLPPSHGDIPDAVFDRYVNTARQFQISVVPPLADQAAWWSAPYVDQRHRNTHYYAWSNVPYGSASDVAHPHMNGAQVSHPGYHDQDFSASQTGRAWYPFSYEQSSEQSLLQQKSDVDRHSRILIPDENQMKAERSLFMDISRSLNLDKSFLDIAVSEWKQLVANESPDEVIFRKKINDLRRRVVSRKKLLDDLEVLLE